MGYGMEGSPSYCCIRQTEPQVDGTSSSYVHVACAAASGHVAHTAASGHVAHAAASGRLNHKDERSGANAVVLSVDPHHPDALPLPLPLILHPLALSPLSSMRPRTSHVRHFSILIAIAQCTHPSHNAAAAHCLFVPGLNACSQRQWDGR